MVVVQKEWPVDGLAARPACECELRDQELPRASSDGSGIAVASKGQGPGSQGRVTCSGCSGYHALIRSGQAQHGAVQRGFLDIGPRDSRSSGLAIAIQSSGGSWELLVVLMATRDC